MKISKKRMLAMIFACLTVVSLVSGCGKDTSTDEEETSEVGTVIDTSAAETEEAKNSPNSEDSRKLSYYEDYLATNYAASINAASILEAEEEVNQVLDGFTAVGDGYDIEVYEYGNVESANNIAKKNIQSISEIKHDGESTEQEGTGEVENGVAWLRIVNGKTYFVGSKDGILTIVKSSEDLLEQTLQIIYDFGYVDV